MKISKLFFMMIMVSVPCLAQDDEKTWFDFWVGKWEVSWTEANATTGKGTNTVARTLENTVIQENFSVSDGAAKGYLGTSISVYNSTQKLWHQGYADNQGTYYNFIGEKFGEKRIFKTEPIKNGEKLIIQRMVFHDITTESFTWDWELSEDGGKTWKLNWQVKYKKLL